MKFELTECFRKTTGELVFTSCIHYAHMPAGLDWLPWRTSEDQCWSEDTCVSEKIEGQRFLKDASASALWIVFNVYIVVLAVVI